jgi:hypothetical protein
MPLETLWAILGLAVPAAILLAYAVLVQSRRLSTWCGFMAVLIAIGMVALVLAEVVA